MGEAGAEAIRKEEEGQCPSLCSGPAAAALPLLHSPGPAPGPAPGPGFWLPVRTHLK